MYTQKEAVKEIRAIAKKNGLTFKRQPRLTINNKPAYMFTSRATGQRVLENCTFWTAYESCMNGYIESVL